MRVAGMGLGAFVLLAVLTTPDRANAQAVAFTPNVGVIPDGVSLSTTPVVSADRRYVRLGVNPGFQTINGFSTFPVPAAVSGLGSGRGFRSLMGGPINPLDFGIWYPDDYGMAYAQNAASQKASAKAAKAAKAKAARAKKPLPDPVVLPIKKKTEPRG